MNFTNSKWLHGLILASVYMLGILGILASGGGGSDGLEEDTIGILPLYSFRIGGPLAGSAGNSVINIDKPGEFSLSTEPDVRGSLICDQATEICVLQTVDPGTRILIDDQSVPLFVDDIEIVVEQIWVYNPPGSDRPVAGSVRVHPLAVGPADVIVEVSDCDGGSPGTEVRITTVPATTPACYSWQAFEDLLDNPGSSSDVELRASFAWGAIEFVMEQAGYTLEVFPLIDEDIFFGGNLVVESCDAYSASWPGGPPNPGLFSFQWFDDFANGQVGPADSFRQTFENCWVDDTTDNIDTLLNGIIDFVGYTEVVQNEVITRIGFELAAQGTGKIGGVAYGDEFGNNPLVITETIEENDAITTESPITLTGRYFIAFF